MQGWELLVAALEQLGWISPTSAASANSDPSPILDLGHPQHSNVQPQYSTAQPQYSTAQPRPELCWLVRLLSWDSRTRNGLTRKGRASLQSLVQSGVSLLDQWPSPGTSVLERWVGRRFFLMHAMTAQAAASNSPASSRLCSIACSRVGRDGSALPQWPNLLDWALRMIRRDQMTVLAIPETTLYQPTVTYATVAQLPMLQLQLPPAKSERRSRDSYARSETVQWLIARLGSLASDERASDWRSQLATSPQFSPGVMEPDLESLPLQDRFAMALADRVFVLSVRRNGKIFELIRRRLSDCAFPLGSVFVACTESTKSGNSRKQLPPENRSDAPPFREVHSQQSSLVEQLMDQGAVGWRVIQSVPSNELGQFSPCRSRVSNVATCVATCQVSVAAKHLWRTNQESWHFLSHCTRGSRGALPQESDVNFLFRLWQQGTASTGHPFLTLLRILQDGHLRGTTWLTRGRQASVSLTAVPLRELLSRRTFRSHLGRWDWEPYGLLFRMADLPQARPVIYAPAAQFECIPIADQAYFQPADSKYDWSSEKEWRVLGDIDLRCLPENSVTFFVRRRREAVQLARVSPFPVIWMESE